MKDIFYASELNFLGEKNADFFFESTVAIPIRESIGLFNVQSNMR